MFDVFVVETSVMPIKSESHGHAGTRVVCSPNMLFQKHILLAFFSFIVEGSRFFMACRSGVLLTSRTTTKKDWDYSVVIRCVGKDDEVFTAASILIYTYFV